MKITKKDIKIYKEYKQGIKVLSLWDKYCIICHKPTKHWNDIYCNKHYKMPKNTINKEEKEYQQND